jgi:hypothetical protein
MASNSITFISVVKINPAVLQLKDANDRPDSQPAVHTHTQTDRQTDHSYSPVRCADKS